MRKMRKVGLVVCAILMVCLLLAACGNLNPAKPIQQATVETQPVLEATMPTETIVVDENHEHSFGEWKVVEKATCTEAGQKERACICGEKESEKIEASGHVGGDWVVDEKATCSKTGSKHQVCANCSVTLSTQTIEKSEHSYSKVTTAATCTGKGSETYTCSVCRHSYTKDIAATGHNYNSKVTTAATCTTKGVETYTCSKCSHSYTKDIAAGHKWANATCTTPKTCSVCKATDGSALGHTYKDATSTEPKTCTKCGHTVGSPVTWYEASTYKVGVDIPAGEYYVQQVGTILSYFAICKDSSGDSIIENENFDGHHYVTLENGQYFELSRAKCTSVKNISLEFDAKNLTPAMYRVGIDIPAGEYKCTKTSGTFGYFAVYDNSTANRDIRENDNFENSQYITVNAGEYFYLSRCTATLVQEMSSESNNGNDDNDSGNNTEDTPPVDDGKWSFEDAKKLNGYGQDATDYMNQSTQYLIKAMSANATYKVLYYKYAISYAKSAQLILQQAKDLADARVDLTLNGGEFNTIQEKIDNALEEVKTITDIEITKDNYATYEDQLTDVIQNVYTEALGIQKLSVDIMKQFTE